MRAIVLSFVFMAKAVPAQMVVPDRREKESGVEPGGCMCMLETMKNM